MNAPAEGSTCGRGLAENSAVPAKMGELIASLADNLETHIPTIDLNDPNGRIEKDAYVELLSAFRGIATQLEVTSGRMAGYRELPMARHLERALADPKILDAFEAYVGVQEQLLGLLQNGIERDRQMLSGFRVVGD